MERGFTVAAEKTIRWLHIIDILTANRQGLTVREIHGQLRDVGDRTRPVELRTVQRDIQEMGDSDVIRFWNPPSDGNAERWALQSMPWGRSLSPMAASTLKLVLSYMAGLLPPAALAILKAVEEQADDVLALRRPSSDGLRLWNQKVRLLPGGHNLQPPGFAPDVLKTVYESLANERQLRASYRRPGTEAITTRDYSVLALIVRPPKYQLLVRTDKDPYILSIHRITDCELLDAGTRWPDDFDIDTWLSSGKADIAVQDTQRLRLKTTPELADHWRETPLGHGQTITTGPHGPEVVVDLVQTEALWRYLLGLGDQVTVLEPAILIDWMRDQCSTLATRYQA